MNGPLKGLGVVEFTGLGPAPLAGQLLADLGADVIAIDRRSAKADATDINRRGKRSIALNLKTGPGREIAQKLCNRSDIVIEGFRPGVMERLGLGPGDLAPTVIYGRITGWGQDGPNAHMAGHDINYLALTGALHAMGHADRPPSPPLNLVGDYAGGTMFLLFGLLAALYERQRSGMGQVVDAAMVDGVPAMMGLIHQMRANSFWSITREANILDGAAPFYRCFGTADGKWLSVGCLEPQFYTEFLHLAGLPETDIERQYDRDQWPEMRAHYTEHFATRTRDEWMERFEGSDACVAPVLTMDEAPEHPHNAARNVFAGHTGVTQAATAPRFGRSEPRLPGPPEAPGAHSDAILSELGYDAAAIEALAANGTLT